MRDIYEVLTNLVSGFIINYFLTICLFDVSYEFAAGTTAIFFVFSFVRSYIIRKTFRKTEKPS